MSNDTRSLIKLVALLATIQLCALSSPWMSLFAIPVLIVLAKSASGTMNGNRPMRLYLACLFVAGTSALGEFREVCLAIEGSLATTPDQHPLLTVIPLLPRIAYRTILPFAVGIFALIVFGQIAADEEAEQHAESQADNLQWLRQLESFLNQSNAPAELVSYLEKLSFQVTSVTTQYGKMSAAAKKSRGAIDSVGAASEQFVTQMHAMTQQLSISNQELADMRSDMGATRSEMKMIRQGVDEMSDVLDQFAEIANHQIMKYQPEPVDA